MPAQLFGDEKLIPVRGQLEVLLPQPEIDYAYIGPGHNIDPPDRSEPLNKRIFNEFALKAAGAETKKAPPATYQDDIREDPLKKK